MPESQSLRRKLDRRKQDLRAIRAPWEPQWQELADYIAPTRLRTSPGKQVGQKLRRKIVDSTGTYALRTLASGMHSGITSPARPWFRLTTFDPDLHDYQPVKEYLRLVETKMREVFQASNLYNCFHQGYGDLGLFGQSCGLLLTDRDKVVRMQQLLHGSFWLARDHTGVATTLIREFQWSVERIVGRFGLDRCSTAIRTAYDRSNYDQTFVINHAVFPRKDRDARLIDKRNKPIASVYWEDGGGDRDAMLEESGFDSNPIIAPPWELVAEDHYANSPGMDVLPDVKMLQVEQRDKIKAINKKVDPPMTGPTSMKNNPASLLPGAITYVDDPTGRNGYRPVFDVNLSVNELSNDIRDVRGQIERGLYADLFLMLANMDGIQPRNQFEIAERKEEKLLALGPVLENIYGAQLEPVIDRTYGEMIERDDMLPPPPDELRGRVLKVEYISILAQAQKAVATGALERGLAFVGNLAAVRPEVVDKIDTDESVDQYFDMVGAPPSVIVSDEAVKAIRQQRAEAQERQTQAANIAAMAPALKQGAEAAQVLAETDANSTGSLLSKLGIGG